MPADGSISLEPAANGVDGRLSVVLDPEGWEPGPWPGSYRRTSPFCARGLAHGEETTLGSGGHLLDRLATFHDEAPPPVERDSFFPREEELVLVTAGGAPPGALVLGTVVDRGRPEPDTGRWRTALGDYAGEGIPVLPGHPERVRVRVERPSTLRLVTAGHAYGRAARGTTYRATFRVKVDGWTVLEREQAVATHSRGKDASLDLAPEPDGAPREVELGFEVDGPPGSYGFLAPVLGPADVGSYDARPWGAGRPHVVWILLDTFRADNLLAYGAETVHAPALERLATGSRVFRNVWSTAAWTLPAHASMFSGLYPPQHGAEGYRTPLPESLETVVELLRDAGYRTGAVVDKGFVTRAFGFAQGFERFEESPPDRDLRRTLASARAFLDADDGRPAFLFVHTYRTHHPYTVGVEEDPSAWKELIGPLWARWKKGEIDQAGYERGMLALAPEQRALYLQAVEACDEVLGPFLDELSPRGLLDPGTLVLASDHGESFGEHGALQHGGKLWEERLRVPLLLAGSDIAPGDVLAPASLVDLPRTLAARAGLAPPAVWEGLDLLSLPVGARGTSRVVAAYRDEPSTRELALLAGRRKVHALSDLELLREGRFEAAYDLARDPHEEHPLEGADVAWVAPLLQGELSEALERWSRRLAAQETVELPADEARQLQNLGYAR